MHSGLSNDSGILLARFMVYPYIHNIGSPKFQRLHELGDIVYIMHKTSTDIFESGKQAVREGKDISDRPGGGKDIMSILSTLFR